MEEILTDMVEKLQDEVEQLTAECERLRLAAIDDRETIARLTSAIRKHRDAKGDDRCWLDDYQLYSVLPEGGHHDSSLPPECEFLESCRRFWAQRQAPVARDWRPEEMTIAQLQATIARLTRDREVLIDACVFRDPVSALWHATTSRVRALNPSGSLTGGWINRELAVVAFLHKVGLDVEPTPTVPGGGTT